MEFLIIFNSSILPIFLIVAVAFGYNRLMRPDILQIANLTLMVFAPIFVFDSLVNSRITLGMLIQPMLFMSALTAILILIAQLSARALGAGENERIPLILAGSMINVGNFGLPLIYFTFGQEAVTFSVLYFVAFNFPLSTIAIYISSPEKRIGKILKDIAKIPIFHAMIIALIVSHTSFPIPGGIQKSLGLMSKATIPLLIFILGLQLSNIRISFSQIRFIIPAVLIRLVICPVIAIILFKTMGISGLEKNVAVIQTATPAALLPLMYAIRFNRSPDLLAAMIMVSTLGSGLSLTVLIRLLS